jgi:hypothetical protein
MVLGAWSACRFRGSIVQIEIWDNGDWVGRVGRDSGLKFYCE